MTIKFNVLRNFVSIAAAVFIPASSLAQVETGGIFSWGTEGLSESSSSSARVTEVAAGGSHVVALRADGTVVCWGNDSSGQCDVRNGLIGIQAVAAGGLHSVALRFNGSIRCWGDNSHGQCNIPAGLPTVAFIAAGLAHTVVATSAGVVRCWGDNSGGQCSVPPGLPPIGQVAAGGYHTVALTTGRAVVCWGYNHFGECTVPSTLGPVQQVSAGDYFTVALTTDGHVACWGDNRAGQCNVPAGLSNVVQIAARGNTVIALTSDGNVSTWGSTAAPPAALIPATNVTCGNGFCAVADAIGSVRCWGADDMTQCEVPKGFDRVTAISVGKGQTGLNEHSMFLKSDGSVRCLGDNSYGESSPPSGLHNISAIAAGMFHSVALKSDGTVICWGQNDTGQCTVPSNLPILKAIAAGEHHTIALGVDGAIYGWGDNTWNQISAPTGLNFVALGAGQLHSVGLTDSGNVYCWGFDGGGQTTVPYGLVANRIAAGYDSNIAISPTQGVVDWGGVDDSMKPSIPDPVGIAAGELHYSVLKSDGTVVSWGNSTVGLFPPPASVLGIAQIAAGYDRTYAQPAISIYPDAEVMQRQTGHVSIFMPVAPASDTPVTLTTDDANVGVPGTATVLAGTHQVAVPVTISDGATAGPHLIRAQLSGNYSYAVITVQPMVLRLSTSVTGGGATIQASVQLQSPPGTAGLAVSLTSSDPSANVPASLLVPVGQTQKSFLISTTAVTSPRAIKLTATAGANSVEDNLVLIPARTLGTLTLDVSSVSTGGTATGSVTIAQPTSIDTDVILTSTATGASVPATVTIPAGDTIGNFKVSTSWVLGDQSGNIKASLDGATLTSPITVRAIVPTSVGLNASNLSGNSTANGMLTISQPYPLGTVSVALSTTVSNLTVPAHVVVPKNATSAGYTVSAPLSLTDASGVVQATCGGKTLSQQVTVRANAMAFVNDDSVFGGVFTEGWVLLRDPMSVPVTFSLTSAGLPQAAFSQSDITLAAGDQYATFLVTTIPVQTDEVGSITVTCGTASVKLPFTIRSNNLQSISLSSASIYGSDNLTGSVHFAGPVLGGTVTLSTSGLAGVTFASSTLTMDPGSDSAIFAVQTSLSAVDRSGQIIATADGVTVRAPLTVKALKLTAFGLNPTTTVGGPTVTGTLTLSVPAPVNETVAITGTVAGATLPASATIPSGSSSATLSIPTSPVAAVSSGTIRASFNGGSFAVKLTLNPPGLVSISFNPGAVAGGTDVAATVTISGAAPGAGIPLSITYGPHTSGPSALTIPSGATSISTTIHTVTVGAGTTDDVTATSGAASVTAALLIMGGMVPIGLSLLPGTVVSTFDSTGEVVLSAPAPVGGTSVTLSSSSIAAAVPSGITVAAGATSGFFPIHTKLLFAAKPVTITAIYGQAALTGTLMITPVNLSSFTPSVVTLHSQGSQLCTVTLDHALGGVPATIAITNPSTLISTPASVSVLPGTSSASFAIKAGTIATSSSVTVQAKLGSVVKSITVNLSP